MVEINQEAKDFGIFNACCLQNADKQTEILQFVEQNKFFVILLKEDCEYITNHPIIQQMQHRATGIYTGIAVVVNGVGMEKYKDTFHRSSSYVDQRMIPLNDFKSIFGDRDDIVNFIDIIKEFGEIQIKGIKKVLLRKKILN